MGHSTRIVLIKVKMDNNTKEKEVYKPHNAIMIKAFGEEKCIQSWERDSRCRVRRSSLEYRIKKGWEPEKAITQTSERAYDKRAAVLKSKKSFGDLKVVRIDPLVAGNTHAICKCKCGKDTSVYIYDLLGGKTKSCGCGTMIGKGLKKEKNPRWKGCGEVPGNYLTQIQNRAKNLKRECKLTIEFLSDMFEEQGRRCSLTGKELYFKIDGRNDGTASIDRIDSSKGYIKGNVRWVHKNINIMKMALPDKEFIEFCKDVVKHFESSIT